MTDPLLLLGTFGAVASVVLLVGVALSGRKSSVESRLSDMGVTSRRALRTSDFDADGGSTLMRIGKVISPENETRRTALESRMRQAGLYRRHSSLLFMGVRLLLMVAPLAVGLLLSAMGFLTVANGVVYGVTVGLLGTLLPRIWLRYLKAQRQKNIRRALPDALDVIVICLEGGLSLSASFAKVASELQDAHPLLAAEMKIVQRETQMGRSTGEALRQFANRFDAEELRSLAAVVVQAEKYGASVVKVLRVHADTLRQKRSQHAEAMAQKAPLKLIFPTVLCIFPALYIVLMGPAGVILMEVLDEF